MKIKIIKVWTQVAQYGVEASMCVFTLIGREECEFENR